MLRRGEEVIEGGLPRHSVARSIRDSWLSPSHDELLAHPPGDTSAPVSPVASAYDSTPAFADRRVPGGCRLPRIAIHPYRAPSVPSGGGGGGPLHLRRRAPGSCTDAAVASRVDALLARLTRLLKSQMPLELVRGETIDETDPLAEYAGLYGSAELPHDARGRSGSCGTGQILGSAFQVMRTTRRFRAPSVNCGMSLLQPRGHRQSKDMRDRSAGMLVSGASRIGARARSPAFAGRTTACGASALKFGGHVQKKSCVVSDTS